MSVFIILRRVRAVLAVAVFVAAVARPAPTPALASTIAVTTTSDTLATDGACSIREAIINANNDAAVWPDCAAGSGADTIVLPAGTITLAIPNPVSSPCCLDADQQAAAGDLDILTSMTIVGDPAGSIINGNALDRVFDINPDTDSLPETVTPLIDVSISALTITNGRQNQSGAVRINARATVAMDRCTVSNSNSWADDGGGIYVFTDGALTLTNSTITGNASLLLDAGIKSDGSLAIVNSTITNNSTSGITPNRGQGLGCGGVSCTIRNTIIAGNGAAPRGDTEGFITSLGYNVIGKTTDNLGNPITVITPTTGDQIDVGAAPVALQPLANNGGPTPTHALGAGSIAIDAGQSSGAAIDQRGELRPCDQAAVANAAGGDGADVGAFEVQGVCTPPNAPPNAVDDAATFDVNTGLHTIGVLANDTDPDADALTISAVTQGAHGVVANNGTSVSYTANAGHRHRHLHLHGGRRALAHRHGDGDGHGGGYDRADAARVDEPVRAVAAQPSARERRPRGQCVGQQRRGAGDRRGGLQRRGRSGAGFRQLLARREEHRRRHAAPASRALGIRQRPRVPDRRQGDGRLEQHQPQVRAGRGPARSEPVRTARGALQGAAASHYCGTHDGTPPPGFVTVGDGPIVGPKQ